MDIAVVTGASSGIGKEFVKQLSYAKNLDEIWVIARRTEKLMQLQEHVKRIKIRILSLDLTKDGFMDAYKKLLENEAPNVKLLVNAAGFGKIGSYSDIPLQDCIQMVDLNVSACIKMTLLTIPYMKMRSNIINVVSSSAFQPLPDFNVYASTKAFMLHYTRALHVELKSRCITATAVCPGWVDTNFVNIAQKSKNPSAIAKFPFMTQTKYVVKKALCDAKKGKSLSIYGLPANLQHLLAKFIPSCLLMKAWMLVKK